MKRDPALVSLSRDHHHALSAAQKLRRANAETAADSRAALVAYWEDRGRVHFRLEEEVLFPAYAAYGDPYDALIARALCDHVAIRQRIATLDRDRSQTVAALHELGGLIAEHVRLEEREVFPLIEAALPAAELAAVAAALLAREAASRAASGDAGG
jgi:hemerythrin-like domain-containing protein